jgi:5'-3' exonuclease
MGIPSFYKHIIQTISGVTTPTHAPPEFFGLDLNCAIYHCAKKVQQSTPYTPAIKPQWEADLIMSVVQYIKTMTVLVKPTQTVYIAVDGVAPMAKIKQQRLRRFRSAIQAQEEAQVKAQALGQSANQTAPPRWDTTAITPGTEFMKALSTALRAYTKVNKQAIVSPADEPGEGEQKIMEHIRQTKPKTAVIYGLDADLIVLALWANATHGTQLALFREEMEFSGAVKINENGDERFLYLLTDHLANALYETYKTPTQQRDDFLRNFVALMNLLGNDFVPHGMALKIKDNGVETLLELTNHLTKSLVEANPEAPGHYRYNQAALTQLFETLAQTEQTQILRATYKKLTSRVGMTASNDPVEQAMARYNDQPIQWAAETVFATQVQVAGKERPQWVLKPKWRQIYDKEALMGADPTHAANLYLDALAWTLAYYAGEPIDLYFYYPWYLPPRFETIHAVLKAKTTPMTPPNTQRTPLKPLEQLAMVLPQTSFHLLPPEFQKLPTMYPHAFPSEWPLFSLGRKILWETEPCIPLIQPDQIKNWIDTMYDQ